MSTTVGSWLSVTEFTMIFQDLAQQRCGGVSLTCYRWQMNLPQELESMLSVERDHKLLRLHCTTLLLLNKICRIKQPVGFIWVRTW